MRYTLLTLLLLACSRPSAAPVPPDHAVATFAGGCFWCMEAPFDKTPGVVSTTSGYTAGQKKDPSYKEVSAGTTGHTEAIRVVFDPKEVSYEELLELFWRNIDPTVKDRQFCDHGSQYRTGIYWHDDAQKVAARASKAKVATKFPKVHTEVQAATVFYPAEGYHQDYYKKNPGHYQRYRKGCGRDARLKALWGASAH